MKTNTIIILIIIILVAANVYQFRNPQVVEVPGEQTAIDSTAWVQRAAYSARGVLLDSLEAKNEKLAERIRKTRDEIANVTDINGRLNLQVDSLETVSRLALIPLPGFETLEGVEAPPDTSYNFIGVFGNGLFRVDSEVKFHKPSQGLEPREGWWIENNLELTQTRDIRISVINTISKDRSRMLTYVTSKDFEELNYQTYTELKRRKRWPWFLVGVGVGVVGIELIQ